MASSRSGDGRLSPIENAAVVGQTGCRIVQSASETSRQVEVDQRHGQFHDFQTRRRRLHPDLQGHRVAGFRHMEAFKGPPGVGLEPTEGIGEREAEPLVDLRGDLLVNPPPGRRRQAVAGEPPEIAATADDVGRRGKVGRRRDELGASGRNLPVWMSV